MKVIGRCRFTSNHVKIIYTEKKILKATHGLLIPFLEFFLVSLESCSVDMISYFSANCNRFETKLLHFYIDREGDIDRVIHD